MMTTELVTPEILTDELIEHLRSDVMKEWNTKGKKTPWPEAREILAVIVSALNPLCDPPRRADARRRICDVINARRAKETP